MPRRPEDLRGRHRRNPAIRSGCAGLGSARGTPIACHYAGPEQRRRRCSDAKTLAGHDRASFLRSSCSTVRSASRVDSLATSDGSMFRVVLIISLNREYNEKATEVSDTPSLPGMPGSSSGSYREALAERYPAHVR